MLDLNKLRYFVVLAKTLSFVKATSELGLSQPALTRSIQALEASFQITLFQRSRSGVSLTRDGRNFLPEAEDILSRGWKIEEGMRQLATGEAGRVAFGIGPLAAAHLLPTLIKKYNSERSGVELDIRIEDIGTLSTALVAGEIDFYLGRHAVDSATARYIRPRRISTNTPSALVHIDHPLAKQLELTPEHARLYPKAAAHGMREVLTQLPDVERRQCYWPTVECEHFATLLEAARGTNLIVFGAMITRAADDTSYPIPWIPRGDFVSLPLPQQDTKHLTSGVGIFVLDGARLNAIARDVVADIEHLYWTLSGPGRGHIAHEQT
jgi:DNA-binding transcriptional LysR family regulator